MCVWKRATGGWLSLVETCRGFDKKLIRFMGMYLISVTCVNGQ